MTILGVLLLSLTVLLLLAVPVAFALALSATIAVIFVGGIDLMIVPADLSGTGQLFAAGYPLVLASW